MAINSNPGKYKQAIENFKKASNKNRQINLPESLILEWIQELKSKCSNCKQGYPIINNRNDYLNHPGEKRCYLNRFQILLLDKTLSLLPDE